LPFALQKLLMYEAAIFSVIARSGEQLAMQEQQNWSAAVTWLTDDEDLICR
jgi:hypothetical protein